MNQPRTAEATIHEVAPVELHRAAAVTIAMVLAITGWAWNARTIRSMALSLRFGQLVAAIGIVGAFVFRTIATLAEATLIKLANSRR